MRKKLLLLLPALALPSCADWENITPEQAARGAEAARAWVEVIGEAKREILSDK
tara:strand:+ start:4708 stop:4869 length:162 start_codon:yes stop_codon:yes gene_type:complete